MIWSALFGQRPTVTCWFCHTQTQLSRDGVDTSDDWHCRSCDNRNSRDAHGNLVDAWPDMYREAPRAPRTQQPRRGGPDSRALFCVPCQRNQELVREMLAAYLPDEDDPDYQKQFDGADEYAQAVRQRYPQVCRRCQVMVDERLQQQAQWMHRRELGSALRRSDHSRSQPMRVLPSLRRRRAVLAWWLCAVVAAAVCVVAPCAWYICLFVGAQLPEGTAGPAGLGIAALTYVLRVFNPLWFSAAKQRGARVAGLPAYRRTVACLALLRLLAAVLQTTVDYPPALAAALLADMVLCVRAARSVHLSNGRRPPSRQNRPPDGHVERPANAHPNSDSESTALATDRTAEAALSSLKSLTFGASEANMDQDDNMLGADFGLALPDPWQQRSPVPAWGRRLHAFDDEDEGDAMATAILPGLDTLSFGARREPMAAAASSSVDDELSALLGGGSSGGAGGLFKRANTNSARSSLAPRRPFEARVFNPNRTTGLESRMSAFSIDDDDDDSDQGPFGGVAIDSRLLAAAGRLAAPRAIAALAVLASWAEEQT
ncbi:hypothetical protein IWQ56_000917 [Coemansia nantahalensis]|nr:hypothetical protein IWQ56_000917 [Coemansia nantahalensis]